MFQKIRMVTTSTAIYGFGGLSNQLIGVVLVPLYTREMPVSDYGVLTYVDIVAAVFSMVAVLGIISSLFRYLPEHERAGREKELINTVFFFILTCSLAISVLCMIFAEPIARQLFGEIRYAQHLRLVLASSLASTTAMMFLSLLQYFRKPVVYSVIVFGKTFLGLALNILFVAFLHKGVIGVLLSNVIINMITLIVVISVHRQHLALQFSFPLFKRLMRYGLPMILSQAGAYLLSFTGIYFLRAHVSLEQVGIYGLALKFSRIIRIFVVGPFDQAWEPMKFKLAEEEDHPRLFAHMFDYVVLGAGLFALVISVFAADAIRILATPAYAPAAGLVPFLCLSVVFYGAYRFATLGSELAEKTRIRSMVVMAAGLVNLGLNSVLSRMWGVPGVIFSENLSYFLLFLSMMIYSQHCHPLPYSFRRVSTALVLFAGLYLATRGLEPGTLLGMGIKLVVVSLVPLVFWFGGMLKREEKAALMRIVGALRQRLA